MLRSVKETLVRAETFAFRDRRARKARVPQAVDPPHQRGLPRTGPALQRFIHGLAKAKIELDRKSLSEIAISDPAAFDAIVAQVKTVLGV